MRGDERPVVINKPLGRRDVKTALVINESPRRTFTNEFIPVPTEIYHEGYVGGKRFVVPDSNLDAMATLVNLKMRRRISIRYKHQTSFDIADDDSIIKKLNRLARKIDSIYISDENDDGSEGLDHLKMNVSKPNEKGREDEESLSELQVEVVRSYELFNNEDELSQLNLSDKKMSTPYFCEEMPGRLVNNGMEVIRENSKVSQTNTNKQLRDRDINTKENLIPDKGTEAQATPIPCNLPSPTNKNKAAGYNTISLDNCSDMIWLTNKKKNKETGSIIEKLFSNTNPSRLFRGNEDGKIYSITTQNNKIPCNPLGISQSKVNMDSDSTRENNKTDNILKKFFSYSSPKLSQVNKDDKKYSIFQNNGKLYFKQIGLSQAKVTNNSDSALIPENKKRGTCYSQQLTPLKTIIGVDSSNHKNTVTCQKSSMGKNTKNNSKCAESKDCNSSQINKSRKNKCVDYKSQKDKGLNYDFQKLSKQTDDETWTKKKTQPLNIELDVQADDNYNSGGIYNLAKMQRDRKCLQANCLGEGRDVALKRQVVCIEVKAEDS